MPCIYRSEIANNIKRSGWKMGFPYNDESLNPDNDFVLRGRSPLFRDRTDGYITNSQNTTTTKNLCQNSGAYHPKNYTEELVKTRYNKRNGMDELNNFGGKPRSPSDSSWFTNPVHLSQDYDEYPLFKSMGLPMRSMAGVRRPVGTTGVSLAAQKPKDYALRSSREMEEYVLSHLNKTELQYFPVTMSSTKLVGDGPPLVKPTAILDKCGISQKLAPRRSRSPRRSKSATRCRSVERTFDSSQDLNKLYLMNAEAPTIGSAWVHVTSPYQQELSRLRMEQLRLEEDQLLELKRRSELERIRGPKPKWYEMKTPEFHYEAHKNNELLRSEGSWTDLLRYRSDLTQASRDFQSTLGEVI